MSDAKSDLANEMANAKNPGAKILKPRDAATLIIVDRSEGEPRILLGKRRADLAFMAGKYVFPGGRVDRADLRVKAADDLRPEELVKLQAEVRGRPSVARARALAAAAIREAFEEAGIVIGSPGHHTGSAAAPTWAAFYATGHLPSFAGMTFLARAITPPGRPRRFDTRFFCIDASAIVQRLPIVDGELSGLDWLTLDAARTLDLPAITRVVLDDLREQLDTGSLGDSRRPTPFYFKRNGSFRRDLIRTESTLD